MVTWLKLLSSSEPQENQEISNDLTRPLGETDESIFAERPEKSPVPSRCSMTMNSSLLLNYKPEITNEFPLVRHREEGFLSATENPSWNLGEGRSHLGFFSASEEGEFDSVLVTNMNVILPWGREEGKKSNSLLF